MKYVYYWYHHMIDSEEREEIQKTLNNKDFNAFIKCYKKYNSRGLFEGKFYEEFNSFIPLIYLPDTITVFDDKDKILDCISILDKSNFEKITFSECECG